MLKNYEIHDDELGIIKVICSQRARRITFKGKNGGITATIPSYYNVKQVREIVAKHRIKLAKLLSNSIIHKEKTTLTDGKEIKTVESTLLITANHNVGRGNIHTQKEENLITFKYNPADSERESFQQAFARHIIRTLTRYYSHTLHEMVATIAKECGTQPREVRIGRGQRTLGHCSRHGVITISTFVLFLPAHLRRYIICHELAHLTHFNHSHNFHTLCNQYCQGNEKIWAKELRKFTFPISLNN